MPAPTRSTVVNLGMQTVTLAEFLTAPDGSLTLQQFHTSELLVDPGSDASRPGQIRAAVGQLKQTAKNKGGSINYALPSQAVFARYLTLPGASPEDLQQIIGFEAQQNIPFPIDEVVWDSQALGQPTDGKLNVVLLAIKTDTLEDLNGAVEDNGFQAEIIDVAPTALYNAFRYNYGDLSGCSLLIDIGARTTNLVFIEGDKAFNRSSPIGGNAITQAIAKELNETIEAAELLKREKGFVSLGGSYAEPEDPVVAMISKLSRTTLTRLHAEIARSISYYRANQGGSQPLRAFLAGGSVGMPYILEFFSEKMQMPVEFFNPLRNVSVSQQADQAALAASAHAMGEVVGLALRQVGNCPVEINLRPPTVVRAHQLKTRKPYLIAAAICLFLAIAQWFVFFTKAADVKSRVLEQVNAEVSTLDAVAARYDRAENEQKRLQEVAAPLLTAAVEREAWIQIIDELGANLPPKFIWVTQMTPLSNDRPVTVGGPALVAAPTPKPTGPKNPNQPTAQANVINALQIDGLYLQNPSDAKVIDDFVNNLQKSELFAIEEGDKAKVVTVRSTPDENTWAYTYRIVVPLKNPIALP